MHAPQPAAPPVVFGVANPKGGSQKTSTVMSLGYALAQTGRRTLLVDLDDATNLTYGLHRTEVERGHSIGAALTGDADARDLVLHDLEPKLDLLPAHSGDIRAAERVLIEQRMAGLRRLRGVLDGVSGDYEVILIDSAGRLATLLMGAIMASDWVIVPCASRRDTVLHAQAALDLVAEARDELGAQVQVAGLLRTMVEKPHAHATRLGGQLVDMLAAKYEVPIFRTSIPAESKFNEAEFTYRPVGAVAPMSRTAIAFRELADEIAGRFL